MKINLDVLKQLSATYAVVPVASAVGLKQALAHCEKAPAGYEPILTGADYVWTDADNAYVLDDQKIYFLVPKNIFIWIWDGTLLRIIQGNDALQKWVQGNESYPEGKANSFMATYKGMTGEGEGGGLAVAEPDADETPGTTELPTTAAEEPFDVKFTGMGARGQEYTPQAQNPADLIIKQVLRRAKINPGVKLSKQAPVRLSADDIIDLYRQAQKMSDPDKGKLIAFIKTIKPLDENVIKKSTLDEVVRVIVKSILKEGFDNDSGWKSRASSLNPPKSSGTSSDPDAKKYVVSLANKIWPDPTDIRGRSTWKVSDVEHHETGEVSYLLSQEMYVKKTRHLINKGNKWYYFNPDAKGPERKWKEVPDSEVRVPRTPPSNEDEVGYANEMTGTAAVSPISTPMAFSKRGVREDDDYSELARDNSLRSNCCGAPPSGEVSKDKSGECSKCKESAIFSRKVDEMTTTGDVTGYNIPAAFSKRGGSEAGVEGSEKLGFTLTNAGKKEMQRNADKLLETKTVKDGTPVCNKCGKPLHYAGQIECNKCGKVQ